uniref:HTH CENPB-type domain-containing protein n=1 Tax=Rhizophagus irregularis (strain DAOM 181602 / DAOM 197198 / MUCL 43194) TaxID=747089 RepID=U9UGW5_RHIID
MEKVINPETKHHKAVVSELELALKEFAKQLTDELNVPEGILQFSSGWLQKFKD